MKKTSGLRRAVLVVLLGAHAIAASAAIADGLLEQPRPVAVHLEAQDADCPTPAHVHAQCVLCQLLAQRDLPVPLATRSVDPVRDIEFRVTAAADPPAQFAVAAPRGRSPPNV